MRYSPRRMNATWTGGPAFRASGPTLERERELSHIRWVLEEAAAGRGRMVVIEGPSGIGKSRLLDEARGLASQADAEVLHARGGELERDFPFGVVVGLFEARFARADAQQRDALFRGRAALAGPLLSLPDDVPRHAATTGEFALM